MVKIGIMQPYVFPYIGYFQLINYCDRFVLHDDVQYIKGGWVNRNRILSHGSAKYITLPVESGSSDLKINQKFFTPDVKKQKGKLLRQIDGAYRKAPFYRDFMPVVETCMNCTERNVSKFAASSLVALCEYADIPLEMVVSSDLKKDDSLKCQERVIGIVDILGGDVYVNPAGGEGLYDGPEFRARGLELEIMAVGDVVYRQFDNDFVSNLSIIDVLMFNSPDELKKLLGQFKISKKN